MELFVATNSGNAESVPAADLVVPESVEPFAWLLKVAAGGSNAEPVPVELVPMDPATDSAIDAAATSDALDSLPEPMVEDLIQLIPVQMPLTQPTPAIGTPWALAAAPLVAVTVAATAPSPTSGSNTFEAPIDDVSQERRLPSVQTVEAPDGRAPERTGHRAVDTAPTSTSTAFGSHRRDSESAIGREGTADPAPTQATSPFPDAARRTLADVASMAPRLESQVGTTAWRQELASRINMMIDRGEQMATLRLSPEHLGPLEVRIAIREGETSLWFGVAHAETRQALEQALPRLREQFAHAGLSLGQSTVSHGDPGNNGAGRTLLNGTPLAENEAAPDLQAPAVRAALGLVDTYA
jgi:flagellar hook-length control protein FliK